MTCAWCEATESHENHWYLMPVPSRTMYALCCVHCHVTGACKYEGTNTLEGAITYEEIDRHYPALRRRSALQDLIQADTNVPPGHIYWQAPDLVDNFNRQAFGEQVHVPVNYVTMPEIRRRYDAIMNFEANGLANVVDATTGELTGIDEEAGPLWTPAAE